MRRRAGAQRTEGTKVVRQAVEDDHAGNLGERGGALPRHCAT